MQKANRKINATEASGAEQTALAQKAETGQQPAPGEKVPAAAHKKEIGGRKNGLDPTRYGDWEKNGRCIDF